MGSTVRAPPDAAYAALPPLPARESDRRAGVRWLEARLRDGSGEPGDANTRAIEKCLDLVEFERMLDPRRVHRYVARVADDADGIVTRLWDVLRADEGRMPRGEREKGVRERDGERMVGRGGARRGVHIRGEESERGNGDMPPAREEDRANFSRQSEEGEPAVRGNAEAEGDPREDGRLAGGEKGSDKGTRIAPEFDLRHAILARSKRAATENPAQPKADRAEEEAADAESRSERPSRSDRHARNDRRSRSLSDRDDSRERWRRHRRRRRYRDDFDDSDREYRRYLRRRRRSRSRSRSYSPRRSPSEDRERELRREERRERRRKRELEREERRRQRKRQYAEEGSEERDGKEYEGDQAVERERRERDDDSEYRRARRKRRRRYEDRGGRDYGSDGDYESDDYRERRRHRRHRSRREYRDRDRDRDRDEDEEHWHRRRYESYDRPHPSQVDHTGSRDNAKDYGRGSLDNNRGVPHGDEVRESRGETRMERRPYDGPNAKERPGGILRPGANGIYRPSPRREQRNEDDQRNYHDRRRREDESGLGRDVPRHSRREGKSYRDKMPRQGRDGDDHRDNSRTAKERESSPRKDGDSAEAERAEVGVSSDRLEKKRSSVKLNELRSKVLASMGKKTSSQDLESEKSDGRK